MHSNYSLFRARRGIQAGVIGPLIYLLAFPPGAMAGQIIWTGSNSSSYSDPGNWNCDQSCNGDTAIPNNNNGSGLTFDAIVATGGTDLVNVDTHFPVTVNSLTIGGNGGSSTVNVNRADGPLTLGAGGNYGSVLTVSGGGVLNVNTNASATLELSTGSALVDVGGQVNVTTGGTLTLENTSGGGTAMLVNNGAVNVGENGGVNSSLVLNGAASTPTNFILTGQGTLALTGGGQITGQNGNELLLNDASHTISGSGLISGVALTNSGVLSASGGSLVLDVSSSGTLTNSNPATIGVADGASLTIRNSSGADTWLQNDSSITLNSVGNSAVLKLDSQGHDSTFSLSGGGSLLMSSAAGNQIVGVSGHENLVNSQTIVGSGTISGFANVTNAGTLATQNAGDVLTVSSNLTNWNAGTSTLSGGTYTVSYGGTLQLSSIGSGGIQTISGAFVVINGSGLLTGDGTSNALSSLSAIDAGEIGSGALVFSGVSPLVNGQPAPAPMVITPAGGTLTISANANQTSAPQFNSTFLQFNHSSAVIAGAVSTVATGPDSSAGLALSGGSTVTINSLQNSAQGAMFSSDPTFAATGVDTGSTLNVLGDVTNSGDGRVNIAGVSVDHGSNLNVGGNFNNVGGTFSLTYSSATVTGILSNDFQSSVVATAGNLTTGDLVNAGSLQLFTDNGAASAVTVSGHLDNTLGDLELNGGGNSVTATQFTNTGGFVGVGPGDTLNVTGVFHNLVAGTLTGGTYDIAGGTFQFAASNGNINSIGANATLVLESANDLGPSVLSGTANALANLASNAGELDVVNGATLATGTSFHNSGTLMVSFGDMNVTGDIFNTSAGTVNVDLGTLSASGQFNNAGALTLGQGVTVSGAGFDNASGGTVSFNGSYDSIQSDVTNEGAITSSGTQNGITGYFTNTGSLDVTAGDFTVGGAYTQTTGGSTSVAAGATFICGHVGTQRWNAFRRRHPERRR